MRGTIHILAVDDDVIACQLLQEVLQKEGYQVSTATSGQAAIRLAQDVPFADRQFYTASGKFEFLSAWGEDFQPLTDYPLYLITGKTNTRLNSQVLDRDRDQLPQAWAHPQALAAAGLAPGQEALVESPYGSMRVRIQVDALQRRDTLFLQQGTWLGSGGTANQLTGNVISERGALGAYNQVSVRLAPVPQPISIPTI